MPTIIELKTNIKLYPNEAMRIRALELPGLRRQHSPALSQVIRVSYHHKRAVLLSWNLGTAGDATDADFWERC